MKKTPQEQFDHYINRTFNGQSLLKDHDLLASGTWTVRGAGDERCHAITIGTYQGILKDILAYAVMLPQFWGYGDGGTIQKLKVTNITEEYVAEELHLHLRERASVLQVELLRILAILPENNQG